MENQLKDYLKESETLEKKVIALSNPLDRLVPLKVRILIITKININENNREKGSYLNLKMHHLKNQKENYKN